MTAPGHTPLTALTSNTPEIVDAHCHGIAAMDLSNEQFAMWCTESSQPAAPGTSYFDSPLGLAIRRWCPPVLGLAKHSAMDEYIARRAALGPATVNKLMLRSARLSALLVDTGYGEQLSSPAELGRAAEAAAFEIVRIESLAEAVARKSPAESFVPAVRDAFANFGGNVVAFKSILAYRHGFDIVAEPPDREIVTGHVRAWQQQPGALMPLRDPVILRFLIWEALTCAPHPSGVVRPLQLHVGYGDADLELQQSNPLLLTRLIRRAQSVQAAPLVLLHCYPFHREAAYLASVYPNVYYDIGLISSHTGSSIKTVMRESLELAPFGKLHYSSDGCALAELFYVSVRGFTSALDMALGKWAADGDATVDDVVAIKRKILGGNARALYPGLCGSPSLPSRPAD
jgi:uncharacterized protein